MGFCWSLSSSKFPQISWTFLIILTDLSIAVICIVSIIPLIYNSSNTFTKTLETIPMYQVQLASCSLSYYSACLIIWQDPRICKSFCSLFAGMAKSIWQQVHLFLLNTLVVWSGLGYPCVSQLPKEFLCVSFYFARFWFVIIPFGSMVRF